MDLLFVFQALTLLLVANGAPILINTLFGKRWASPVDFGLNWFDGKRLFGNTKTWRGVMAAAGCTAGVTILFGFGAWDGLQFGLLTMAGDLCASFLKRRCGYVESSQARGFDTLPESILPVWWLGDRLHLNELCVLVVLVAFFLIEEFCSPLLYRWHIRNRPY